MNLGNLSLPSVLKQTIARDVRQTESEPVVIFDRFFSTSTDEVSRLPNGLSWLGWTRWQVDGDIELSLIKISETHLKIF